MRWHVLLGIGRTHCLALLVIEPENLLEYSKSTIGPRIWPNRRTLPRRHAESRGDSWRRGEPRKMVAAAVTTSSGDVGSRMARVAARAISRSSNATSAFAAATRIWQSMSTSASRTAYARSSTADLGIVIPDCMAADTVRTALERLPWLRVPPRRR